MSYALTAILLAPFLILTGLLDTMVSPFRQEFAQVFLQTLAQALLSSFFSVTLGVLGAFGLLTLVRSSWRRPIELLVLLPNLLPGLFVIVAALNMVSWVAPFPFGIGGVVLVHVLMNAGLASVALARRLETALGGAIELAAVEGASRLATWWAVIGGLKRDLFVLGFFVFALTFTAFSVPLIVGGAAGETLEVLIYRAVLGRGELEYGVGLALVQLTLVAAFSILVPRVLPSSGGGENHVFFRRLASPVSLFVLVTVTAFLLLANVAPALKGFLLVAENEVLLRALVAAAWGSFAECLAVGIIIWVLLAAVTAISPHRWFSRFLLAYSAPSAVVLALALFMVFDSHRAAASSVIMVMAFGFAILILPSLYRLRAASRLQELEPQILTARVLGATKWRVFSSITLPQMRRDLSFLAGVAALWTSGDFAFASMVAGRDLTLAISAQGFLGGYRLEVASAVTMLSLAVGLLVYFIFEATNYVDRQKSHS